MPVAAPPVSNGVESVEIQRIVRDVLDKFEVILGHEHIDAIIRHDTI
jgi:hypothetical protein